MFGKLVKKPQEQQRELVLPRPQPKQDESTEPGSNFNESKNGLHGMAPEKLKSIIQEGLINNPDLISMVEDGILEKLQQKYDFTPSDLYRQKEEEKKQYIKQLDGYLEDKKKINDQINGELKAFLDDTQKSLELALSGFAQKLTENIHAAEQKNGINEIKEQLGLNRSASKEG